MSAFININITFAIISSKLKRKTLSQIQELSILPKDGQAIDDSSKLIDDIFLGYIFPEDANYSSDGAKYAVNICIVEQLQTWTRKDFSTVLQMIDQFRVDRDSAVQIIWDWNIHVENYNSLLKDLEKIEKNRQSNRDIVSLLRRESRNVEKLNVQIFKLKENNQILQDQVNILRMNSATTSTSQNDNKLKIDNAKLVIRNIELQNEINSLKDKTSSISLELPIDKKSRSVKMANSLKFSENISDLSYEIWEQLVKDKFIVNVDHFADEYTKATAIVSWTEDKARRHVFARRNVDMIFFKTSQMIFDVLSLIFAKKNKERSIRNKFKVLTMRINQRFSEFFSEFLLLSSQLPHYSEQNLTDELREKLTSQLQRAIVSNGKFSTIESLKELIEEVDQELHSLEVTRFENSASKDISRITSKTSIVKIVAQGSIFNANKTMFAADQVIMKALYERDDIDKGCYRCGDFKHLIRNCPLSKIIDIWLSKKIKQEKNTLTINEMSEFLMNTQNESDQAPPDDYSSDTSSEVFSDHESENV